MKLLRVGPKGYEKPAIKAQDGSLRDLSGIVGDFAGAGVAFEAFEKIRNIDPLKLPELSSKERIGACLASVPTFFCIGLNYAKHAAESNSKPPAEPLVFSKAANALSGPFDDVIIPKTAQKTDWEVELGVVIGKRAHHVSVEEALDYVSAYCVVNDVSERDFQKNRSGQWIKGKSSPTFGPTGPYLVSADEVGDPQNLDLWLNLNDEKCQNSNTSDMVFTVAQIISHMSEFMELQPGDLIATGTPEGVGMGRSPQRFLRAGDVMQLGVEGLGEQKLFVSAYS